MSKPASTVSAAEISRLAGVTRATVSNWRRRHADFPKAIAGSEARPEFDLHQVQAWLTKHGVEAEESPTTELRTLVRSQATADEVAQLMRSLRRSGGEWLSKGIGSGKTFAFVAEALRTMELATAADGARAAVDVLAERALEAAPVTGLYITPAPVAELMAALLDSPGALDARSVLDPACGSGSLLLAAAGAGAVDLYGQDVQAVQTERTRLAVEAATDLEPTVHTGDSLTADAFADLEVDAVLCNPPYGQRDWGADELAFDTRWEYGVPPRGESELAWVQHALAHLRPGGTAVLLLPPAVASRGSGRRIRAALLRAGALRAAIGLPPGVAQPWHVGLQMWLLRRPEPGVPVPDTVLFMDTTGLSKRTDDDDSVDWAVVTGMAEKAWRGFDGGSPDSPAMPGVAIAVRVVDVLDEEVDLTPARYVRSSLDSGTISDQVDDAKTQLTDAVSELATATDALGEWSVMAAKPWRSVTIADLANRGPLQWFRACPSSPDPIPDPLDPRRVLTARDIATGVPASGTLGAATPAEIVEIEAGDVLISAVRSDRSGGRRARVAGPEDVGGVRGAHVHLLRTDPDRFDAWFLAGVVTGTENGAATRTSTARFDLTRLRIPLLALPEQQRYGAAFRRLYLLRMAARRADEAAEQVADLVMTGLTAGVLTPDDSDVRNQLDTK
ncbi:N-6 DNA methylase [Nocardia sp. CA-084685]|uniref:N-6 DNA methylase n=1 Tax=Nocardia sp. CA-084685 TaxID=3239970 RepID=UPI003D957FF5